MATTLLIIGFFLAVLASRQVGRFANIARLPLITGYLAAGVLVGPFFLDWISHKAALSLRPVDQMALAFIAFAAGNELYFKEFRSRLRSIAWITVAQFVATYTLGTAAVVITSPWVPFLAELPMATRVAVGLMAAAILVARSPSSAIAIISELRARGPFTKNALGVTVVMDALVILLFAISVSAANALISAGQFDLLLLLRVTEDLLLSAIVGVIAGKLIQMLIIVAVPTRFKTGLTLVIGFGIFAGAEALRHWSEHQLEWRIAVEPLLACMLAGFFVTNFSQARDEFSDVLESVAPAVYITFFTLVGASLAIDALIKLWHITLVLFAVRLLGIFLGSVVGSQVAGDPPPFKRFGWLVFITQAGVGLGLAKDVADEFATFGTQFATMIVAVIVINQVIGPPLFKFAIKAVGEARLRAKGERDEIRDALVLGIDDQSLAVARQLTANGWKVIMADTDPSHVDRLAAADVDERVIDAIDEASLREVSTKATDALVAMLADDESNYIACELAYERLGIKRLVVRLHDLAWSDKFAELGAAVVDPASAMVNLLDQFVRAPNTAALFLHRDPEHEIVQITLDDPDIDGMPLRDLRLPVKIRVLEITRDGTSIVPHGHTTLRLGDEVTFVGEVHHLEEVVNRWGY